MSDRQPPHGPNGEALPPGFAPEDFEPVERPESPVVPTADVGDLAGEPTNPPQDPPAMAPNAEEPQAEEPQTEEPQTDAPVADSSDGAGEVTQAFHEVTDPNLGADPSPWAPTASAAQIGNDPAGGRDDEPSGTPPGADEPTVVDLPPPPYQTDYHPGQPYPQPQPVAGHPSPPAGVAGPDYQGAGMPSDPPPVYPPYASGDGHGGYEPPVPPFGFEDDGYDDDPNENRANPILVLISGILMAVVLAGGGYIWFSQNQAAKTNQQKALEAAQSEAKIAQEEAKKAQEEAKKAQDAAKQQIEEAAKKASEEAARASAAASLSPVPSPAASQPAAPAPPASPAQPTQLAQPTKPAKPAKPASPNRGNPLGNGCTPGGNTLPDGIWYAYAWEEDGGMVGFDLVCYYTDGSVTNDNTKKRVMPAETGYYPSGGLTGLEVSGGIIIDMWDI